MRLEFLSLVVVLGLAGCSGDSRRATVESIRTALNPGALPPDTIPEMLDYAADLQVDLAEMAKLPLGVLYADIALGDTTVTPIVPGDSVEILVQGWTPDATKVDSAVIMLRVGAGDVIAGIDAVLPGMLPGGRRKLVIPPGLAFGAEGRDNIPPNAVLVYDVELRARIP